MLEEILLFHSDTAESAANVVEERKRALSLVCVNTYDMAAADTRDAVEVEERTSFSTSAAAAERRRRRLVAARPPRRVGHSAAQDL